MPQWTPEALQDLDAIFAYIAADNPDAAAEVAEQVAEACGRLDVFPLLGRAGTASDTRELVLPRIPYLVVYQLLDGVPSILRVLHAKMRWPI
ncbi:MAG: type II toxin-antitoxin system RelE/ParE family toxin [Thermodesulfobacteriota bacterium]